MRLILSIVLIAAITLQGYNQESPNKYFHLIAQGVDLDEAGRYDEALVKFKEALQLDNKKDAAYYQMAVTYQKMGDAEKAQRFCEITIQRKGEYLEVAYMLQVKLLMVKKDYAAANIILEKALQRFSSNPRLHYLMGVTSYKLKDLNRAQAALQSAVLIDITHQESHLLLANIMRIRGKRTESLLPLYYVVFLDPEGERATIAYDMLQKQLVDIAQDPFEVQTDSSAGWFYSDIALNTMARQMGECDKQNQAIVFDSNTVAFMQGLDMNVHPKEGFWRTNYIRFYKQMNQKGHTQAFADYVALVAEPDKEKRKKQLEKMDAQLNAFGKWFGQYRTKNH